MPRTAHKTTDATLRVAARRGPADGRSGQVLSDLHEIQRQLAAIGRASDAAAHSLINAVESLQAAVAALPAKLRGASLGQIDEMLEIAAFGDLIGQRVSHARAAADRTIEAIATYDPVSGAARMAACGPPVAGPQAPGDGLDQSAIDSLFT